VLQVLTDEQVNALVNVPDLRTRQGRKDRAFLSILAYGGLRIQEACSLRRDEVRVEGDRVRLTFAGKGGKTRTVSLPQRAVSGLVKHMQSHTSPYVFTGRGGLPMTPNGGYKVVERNAIQAGLPSWVHPHTLRHSYGTKLMRETGDIFLVSRVLGHANMQTTARFYLAFDQSYADRAADVWR
jgi:integrase